jgi:hypothetical protein
MDKDEQIETKLQDLANLVAELMDLGLSQSDIVRQVDGVFEVYTPEG